MFQVTLHIGLLGYWAVICMTAMILRLRSKAQDKKSLWKRAKLATAGIL